MTLANRTVLSALFLSTGAALLIYVLSGISLLAAVGLTASTGLFLSSLVWVRARPDQRKFLQVNFCVGVTTGVIATLSYDISRFVLIKVTGIRFWPYDIFTIFGKALVGENHSSWWVTALGILYHFANGIGFALAYTIWLGKKGVWAGLAFAFVLEALMVSVYPGWLGLKALDEFLQVSIVGHVVYGVVLGGLSRLLLSRYGR